MRSQDWGQDSVLAPSFSTEDRFQDTLDLFTNHNETPDCPGWTQSLILYQLRIDKFGDHSTIQSALERVHYLKHLGINGVVLNPIAKSFKGLGTNEEWGFYSHLEPDSIDSQIGTDADFQRFVDSLHLLGIKVFLDFEFHGVFDRDVFIKKLNWPSAWSAAGSGNTSSLLGSHPEFFNWVTDTFGTHPSYTGWNTAELVWKHPNGSQNLDLMDWYKDVLINDWIIKFDLDGLRLDLEPFEVAVEVGYAYWEDIRRTVEQISGKKILLIPEDGNAERNQAFAFAQEDFGVNNPRVGALWGGSVVKDFMISDTLDIPNTYDSNGNLLAWGQYFEPVHIVDEVKDLDGDGYSRNETYYTSALSSHDRHEYSAKGRLVYFGYGMLFQPFIPFWFMGEEFNASKNNPSDPFFDIIYYNRLNWSDLDANRLFFNEVRKMIYIRKKYQNLIGPSTGKLNDKAMVKIDVYGDQPDLPPYGYFNPQGDTLGIVVFGTKNSELQQLTVRLPMSQMRLEGAHAYSFHDLLKDTVLVLTPDGPSNQFTLPGISSWGNAIYAISPLHLSTENHREKDPLEISVFPNPNHGTFNLKYCSGKKKSASVQGYTIQVFDSNGLRCFVEQGNAKVAATDCFEKTINLKKLPKGIFNCQITFDGEESISHRFVIH